MFVFVFFFFNDTATTEIYTLSLHDALPIFKSTEKLVSQFDGRTIYSELHEDCYEVMRKISVDCSEDMRKFAGKIIAMSVNMLKQNAPCALDRKSVV